MSSKRPARLVSYPDSEEDDTPKKRIRTLPPLSKTIQVPVPEDNPSVHLGRIRSSPHVEGQFATHVYICLSLDNVSKLRRFLSDAFACAAGAVPSLHPIWSLSDGLAYVDLHISISRCIFLRTHQREDFKRSLKDIAKRYAPFSASFTTFSELQNDEGTRTFLTIEVGAGYPQLQALSRSLEPILEGFLQPQYYTLPKYHASIGWALLHKAKRPLDDSSTTETEFATIDRLPENLISTLNKQYQGALSSKAVGWFEVNDLTVKIGKDTFVWALRGTQ